MQQYAPAIIALFVLLMVQSLFFPDPSTRGVLEPQYRIAYGVMLGLFAVIWPVAHWANRTGCVNLLYYRIFVFFFLADVFFLAILDNIGRQDVSAICATLFLLPVVLHMSPRVYMAVMTPFSFSLALGIAAWGGLGNVYWGTLIQLIAYTVISIMVQKSLFSNRLDRYLCQLEILEANSRIARLASRDSVTGLYNQKHFDSLLAAEWQRSKRHSHVFTLIQIDLDFLVGDEVLRQVGGYLQTLLRRSDHAARVGDAKFMLLLVETEMGGARTLAERLRLGLAQLPCVREMGHSLTASIGLATSSEAPGIDDLCQLVMRRLHAAKHKGPGHIVAT